MKLMTAALTLVLASTASAHAHDRVYNKASELLPLCKAETYALYIAKGITPYQWTASHHSRSNVLYVNGRLRVHGDDVTVRCRVARGAREQYATVEVDDPVLQQAAPAGSASGT